MIVSIKVGFHDVQVAIFVISFRDPSVIHQSVCRDSRILEISGVHRILESRKNQDSALYLAVFVLHKLGEPRNALCNGYVELMCDDFGGGELLLDLVTCRLASIQFT